MSKENYYVIFHTTNGHASHFIDNNDFFADGEIPDLNTMTERFNCFFNRIRKNGDDFFFISTGAIQYSAILYYKVSVRY